MAAPVSDEIFSPQPEPEVPHAVQQNGNPRPRNFELRDRDPDVNQQLASQNQKAKNTRIAVKLFVGALLFLLVLGCATLSKLTLVSMTDSLRNLTRRNNTAGGNDTSSHIHEEASALYWQLLLVMIIPHVLTLLRSLVSGVLGKTTKNYPWPKPGAVLGGLLAAVFEVLAMTCFVFVVLASLPPVIAILLLNGTFLVQIFYDMVYTAKYLSCSPICARAGYRLLNIDSPMLYRLFENKSTKLLAVILQVGSITGLAICFVIGMDNIQLAVLAPLSLFILSMIWLNRTQEYLSSATQPAETQPAASRNTATQPAETQPAASRNTATQPEKSARWKASFIGSTIRILLYPFVAYAVFRISYPDINPWSSDNSAEWKGERIAVFLVQVFSSMFGYLFASVACTMTLHQFGFALPLLLCTPLSVLSYGITQIHWHNKNTLALFPFYYCNKDSYDEHPLRHHENSSLYIAVVVLSILLYISEIITMTYYIWTRKNAILARDDEMFIAPHYNGVFLEQHLILNRKAEKPPPDDDKEDNILQPRYVFICSTMFRETRQEMKELLTSIRNVAHAYQTKKRQAQLRRREYDRFESHIFFDNGCCGRQLTFFALQLVSLLKETLNIDINECLRIKTPYGYKFSWRESRDPQNHPDTMPFEIHLKDNLKVKRKKRWSQIMYMKYVIEHRMKANQLDNTFILTTDADVEFSNESVELLLDMISSSTHIGGVCARTHPKGSGPIYWYQVFDYAVGHWFQKASEHVLGTVVCCPGCFSLLRCSALKEILDTYSTEVNTASEFLMKDMGEDRWLSTLMIRAGRRMEYCALSENSTQCPESFNEFFRQRRRWIASTVVNLFELISLLGSITSNNDSVTIFYIIYEALMVFSTLISPATVILIVATGLTSTYGHDIPDGLDLSIIVILLLVSVAYGIICLYANQKTQLNVAKVLTFIFAVVMAVVLASILHDTIDDFIDKTSELTLSDNSTDIDHEKGPPFSLLTMYIALFVVLFVLAAVVHPSEWTCLIYGLWYFIALPTGNLFLLIYTAANIDKQSWGTREEKPEDQQLDAFFKCQLLLQKIVTACLRRCCEVDLEEGEPEEEEEEEEEGYSPQPEPRYSLATAHPPVQQHLQYGQPNPLDDDVNEWLRDQECTVRITHSRVREFARHFEEHGYTNKGFISGMTREDFEAIGIDERGYVLRLEKAAQELPPFLIKTGVPDTVEAWLEQLQLREYRELFHRKGYKFPSDLENLKGMTRKDLQALPIWKRAHLKRLMDGIQKLSYESEDERKAEELKEAIEALPDNDLDRDRDEGEDAFWRGLVEEEHAILKPLKAEFTAVDQELAPRLRALRNIALAILLLINIIWIVLLYSLKFSDLAKYGLPTRAFNLLFLAVYSLIIIVQFTAMVCHRVVTLVHYIGRPDIKDFTLTNPANEEYQIVEMETRASDL